MAKKRKKKVKLKEEYANVIIGIFVILFSIIGIFTLGPVGRIIAGIFMFLFGAFYIPMMIFLALVGIIFLFKSDEFEFFSLRMLGVYFLILGILILFHYKFNHIENFDMAIVFKNSMDTFIKCFDEIFKTGHLTDWFSPGGGLIGCVFSMLLTKLLSYTGMLIVAWVMAGLGVLLFTGFSIIDFLKNDVEIVKEKVKEKKEKKEEKEEEEIDEEKEEELGYTINGQVIPGKRTINSLEDLTKNIKEDETPKEKEEPPKNDVVLNKNYRLPRNEDVLIKPKSVKNTTDYGQIDENKVKLVQVLKDFGIAAAVVNVNVGPAVSQYELEIASGTRVNKITSINREIALALAKKDVRIEAPIPGKNTVGVEFANEQATPVSFYEMMSSKKIMEKADKKLMVPLGKSIMGDVETCEINKMPHLLIAGTTGSGKSVCVNGIICSILMRARPDEVKLAMVDPKVVELSVYNGVPHLLAPVVTEPKKAAVLLAKMVQEMEDRYQTFSDSRTKNIEGYNEYVEKENQTLEEDAKLSKMPYIVVIIDELADLMMVAAKEVEDSILRITQKARAAGIHLIVATQRPSTEVITGLIKANIPSRIAFAVGSGIDSRTILDQIGAEKLLGKGDMLYMPIGVNSPQRIQGSFITDDEIKNIIDFTVSQQKAQYSDTFLNLEVPDSKSETHSSDYEDSDGDSEDDLYNDVVEFVISSQKASASLIQRKFKVGYNRAARLVDILEERGIIGPQNGSKPREVLVQMSSIDENSD